MLQQSKQKTIFIYMQIYNTYTEERLIRDPLRIHYLNLDIWYKPVEWIKTMFY